MRATLKLITILAIIASSLSCRMLDEYSSYAKRATTLQDKPFDNVLVQRSGNLLHAKLPGIMHQPHCTRASKDMPDLVSLESLLDRSKTETMVFKNYHIVQIPFYDLDYGQTAVLSNSRHGNPDDVSMVRKFLVETVDTVNNVKNVFVSTLVPTPENCERYGPDSYSYINKETFEGIIIFSDLDGKLRGINSYGMRPIRVARIIQPKDSLLYRQIRYLSIYSTLKSRSGNRAEELEESVCIGERRKNGDDDEDSNCDMEDENFDNVPDPSGEGGCGGSSGNNEVNGGPIDPAIITEEVDTSNELEPSYIQADSLGRKNDDIIWYMVSLTSIGPGKVYGSGRYSNREQRSILCEACPEAQAFFDRWTGDFHGQGFLVRLVVRSDITSTAYFAPEIGDPDNPFDPVNRPCHNSITGVGNPLNHMSIASPGYSGLRGGTFGHVRSGGARFHSGLDLYAEEGTPVYAMIDGEISKNNYVTTQPNKFETEGIDDKGYPANYSGDTNDAGNRITIKGQYNGNDVMIGYWHLQAGTPLAVNPRTGQVYKPGDKIYRGELLGYTGRTGNAYNVTNKHLHLIYKVKGTNGRYAYANPEEIINGSVNWNDGDPSTKRILGGSIIEIECDTEEKRNIL
ncbi:MAG TPA: hypothetical protein DDX40_03500 [Rikenellaceae bacterium]|nr:hypothetical protein [Rikenellaceae bacterium]